MRTFVYSEWTRAALCLLSALLASYILIYSLSRPVAWIVLSVTLAALLWAVLTRKPLLQYTAVVILSLCIMLFVTELFLSARNVSTNAVRLYNGQARSLMDERDDLLGYRPKREAAHTRTQKLIGDTIIYDVMHSTDATGRRITPSHPEAKTAVLFFGCSFTAGVGVNDTETYPYRVAIVLGPQYQVWNMGVGGYGPHQFLALLESDRLTPIFAGYERVFVFFLSLATHEQRVGGLVEWEKWGPRYVMENGEAVHKGSFALPLPVLTDALHALKKSELFRSILIEKLQWRRAELLALQKAIFAKAHKILQEKYHTPLTVLLYPDAADTLPALQSAGLSVLEMGIFLPGWPDAKYTIAQDGHPAPLAHECMAQGIADYVAKSLPR